MSSEGVMADIGLLTPACQMIAPRGGYWHSTELTQFRRLSKSLSREEGGREEVGKTK